MNAGSQPLTSPSKGEASEYESGGHGHQPVLYHEIIEVLNPVSTGRYIDGTVGAGGHARGILQASSPDGLLLGMDLDRDALALARTALAPFGERAHLVHGSYTQMAAEAARLGWDAVDGILLDLGFSSMQVDNSERGFSLRSDAPLDMRFDNTSGTAAAELVNHLPERDLADLIWRYGEEQQSRRIARAITQNRPIASAAQLSEVIANSVPRKRSGIHPATLTFQALRIAVNHELENVAAVLPAAVNLLKPDGRLAVISFHSLEDRIVKQFFHTESRDCLCQPSQLICTCHHKASLKEISRKPLIASPGEAGNNPRSRSAKLRVVQKL